LRIALAAVWAVIVSTLFLQAANGLQTDVIGLAANARGFGPAVTGLMMAAYYVGYSAAPLAGRRIVARFGHVAVIIVCAAAAAAVIAVQPFIVTAPVWAGLRAVSGFALSLTNIGYESWLNDRVPTLQRGRVFSVYVFAQMIGLTGAQCLLATGRAPTAPLFLSAAGLFAIAAVPVAAARRTAPHGVPPAPLGIVALFRTSPLGAGATLLAGLAWAIMFTFGPIYARRTGLSVPDVALFMALAMAAGCVLQIPLGWLSDIVGRKPMIVGMFAIGLVASLFGIWAGGHGQIVKFLAISVVGGFTFPIYAVSVAQVNDHLSSDTRVAAAAGLVLLFGIGSFFGPLLCGALLGAVGPGGFYLLLAVTTAVGAGLAAARR